MSTLLDSLMGQLDGQAMGQIGRQLGTDPQATSSAVSAALPLLLGALARNASKPDGAKALSNALQKDHDGSVLDNLGSFLGNAQAGPGDAILGHVLGARRPMVEAGLGRASGLDASKIGPLLTMLAPVVLGALGRAQRENRLDAPGLAGLLGSQQQAMQQRAPQQMGILGALLDTDGDGDVDATDVAKHGIGILGKLFGRK